jgi:hypothetical protein
VCFTIIFKCFSCVFASVSDACFKCFICLQMYVSSVASGFFKSRSSVASPSSLFVASSQYLLSAPGWYPLPPLPFLDAGNIRCDTRPV